MINQQTGEQLVDQATGLPMWQRVDDETSVVLLGMACPAQTPTFLPATGDGTTAPFVEDYSDAVPFDWWGYAEY
jgi:hypothetical protein